MPEKDNKTNHSSNTQPKKQSSEKKTRSKEVLERARRILAARKRAELQKAAEERKERMEQRAEQKKRQDEAKKNVSEKRQEEIVQKKQEPVAHTPLATDPLDGEFVEFAVTARKYQTLLTKKYKERRFWENPSPYEIQSYIPGTIVSVDVKVGKVVQEGVQLLILEAMKMQNRIDMPFTARIKKINVKVGERIPKDFVMIELED